MKREKLKTLFLKAADYLKRSYRGAVVYVSDDYVDLAVAEPSFSGMKITRLERIPFGMNSRNLSEEELFSFLGTLLNEFFENEGKALLRIATNIRNDYFIVRRFSFPEVPDTEAEKVAVFEAQKYLPCALGSLSYRIRKLDRNKGTQSVVLAGAENKDIAKIIKVFGERGLFASVIEAEPLLVARGMELSETIRPSSNYLSIHFEPISKVVITAMRGSQPFFMREIILAKDNVSAKGMRDLKEYSLELRDVWGAIEMDVANTYEFLKKDTGKDVEKIFISGFARSDGDEEVLSRFQKPVKRIDLKKVKGVSDEDKDRFIPAIALLYDTFNTPLFNLSFPATSYNDPWTYKPVAVMGVWLASIILVAHLGLGFYNGAIIRETAGMNSASDGFRLIPGISASRVSKKAVEDMRDARKKTASFLSETFAGKYFLAEKISRLSPNMSGAMWIGGVSFSVDMIKGKTEVELIFAGNIFTPREKDIEQLNDFVGRLKSDPKFMAGFKSIRLSSVKKEKAVGDKAIWSFQLILGTGNTVK
ncbi:MAG: hypothetical protein HQL30_08175 [Candidatus Omnitrophica bacterium]|nr:hypothetical protein [Candidatus Omnitrophota bacterium]